MNEAGGDLWHLQVRQHLSIPTYQWQCQLVVFASPSTRINEACRQVFTDEIFTHISSVLFIWKLSLWIRSVSCYNFPSCINHKLSAAIIENAIRMATIWYCSRSRSRHIINFLPRFDIVHGQGHVMIWYRSQEQQL